MNRVAGKVAIVSGGASGIGRACVLALWREGASVLVGDIDEAGTARLAEQAPGIRALRLDVTDPVDWQRVFDQALQAWNRVDVLVNSAGIVIEGEIGVTGIDAFRRVTAVNLDGTYLGCRAALDVMLRTGSGSIVNIGSVAGLIGDPPGIPSYTASKGGVIALTRALAVQCMRSARGVRCNVICPGNIRTPMLEQAIARAVGADRLEETLQELASAEPMGQPEDVAALALYLASDESRLMNGAVLPLDGGFSVS